MMKRDANQRPASDSARCRTRSAVRQTLHEPATKVSAAGDVRPKPVTSAAEALPQLRRKPAQTRARATSIVTIDPSMISLYRAFNIGEEALALRYAKEIAGAVEVLRRGEEQLPVEVCDADEPGRYHLVGRPPMLLAARMMRATGPGVQLSVIVRPNFDAAAFYRAMTATLRRPSDWERYAVANYHVQQARSARAAMAMLGLDPGKDESAFSRLMSLGKLGGAVPGIDPFTVTATTAARVMALRTSPAAEQAMNAAIEAATTSGEILDARKLLPGIIAAIDPDAVAPEMTKLDGPGSGWTFGRAGAEPFALVRQQPGVRWSIKLLRGMNAASWRAFGKAMATHTS
jgi:hypothetical protein